MEQFFINSYDTQWFMASTKIQKLLLFILKKTTKAYIINVSFLTVLSLEGFGKVCKIYTHKELMQCI